MTLLGGTSDNKSDLTQKIEPGTLEMFANNRNQFSARLFGFFDVLGFS